MNKLLLWIKNTLIFVNILLLVIYLKNFSCVSSSLIFLFCLLLYVISFFSIKDLIKKDKINNDSRYNILFILVEVFIAIILLRTLYDTGLIYNSKHYMDIIKSIYPEYGVEEYKYINIAYFGQNLGYFIIMMFSLLLYRKINIEKSNKKSKYSIISIICLLVSIYTIIPTLEHFNIVDTMHNFPIYYLFFTILLITVEIVELIRNNGKKKEWIIFISFFFNLFAVISIFT